MVHFRIISANFFFFWNLTGNSVFIFPPSTFHGCSSSTHSLSDFSCRSVVHGFRLKEQARRRMTLCQKLNTKFGEWRSQKVRVVLVLFARLGCRSPGSPETPLCNIIIAKTSTWSMRCGLYYTLPQRQCRKVCSGEE